MLSERHIVVGICGSISAYKSLYLIRRLRDLGASIAPVMTQSACQFITPLSVSVLANCEAVTSLWQTSQSIGDASRVGHVELSHKAELMVIAPATADCLARLVIGRADDALCALALSTQAPLLVVPAMESGMWEHPATQQNVQTLRARGVFVLTPESGFLASGRMGVGRMAEPEIIIKHIQRMLSPQDLEGENVVVTAGATRESLDPARFLSNRSTGKMGFALAEEAWRRGASVHLIAGPVALTMFEEGSRDDGKGACMTVSRVETTQEMLEACQKAVDLSSIFMMAAAPVDFTPHERSHVKIKKDRADAYIETIWQTTWDATPDILKTLRARTPARWVVGFAAESHDLESYARKKLLEKDLDMIVANDISRHDAGFATDTNAVSIFKRDGSVVHLETCSKVKIAQSIWDEVVCSRKLRHAAGHVTSQNY